MAAYQQALATARAEAQAAVKETTDRLAAEAAERQRQLSETLAEQTAAAERQIAAAKQRRSPRCTGSRSRSAGRSPKR